MDDIHQYVLNQLDDAKGRWPEIATKTGVPYQTLTKIAQRRTRNPGIGHIQKLADYFRQEAVA
jgi:transcriptional regulator with XRE-family HTH domain